MNHAYYFPLCTLTIYFPCLPFLSIVLQRKRSQPIDSSFFRKSLAIRQLNIQAATTENDEQCTLSNAMYINFQNCYFLIWGPL